MLMPRQVYTRAQRSDFDSWNSPGWSADELYPFLKKVSLSPGVGDSISVLLRVC